MDNKQESVWWHLLSKWNFVKPNRFVLHLFIVDYVDIIIIAVKWRPPLSFGLETGWFKVFWVGWSFNPLSWIAIALLYLSLWTSVIKWPQHGQLPSRQLHISNKYVIACQKDSQDQNKIGSREIFSPGRGTSCSTFYTSLCMTMNILDKIVKSTSLWRNNSSNK